MIKRYFSYIMLVAVGILYMLPASAAPFYTADPDLDQEWHLQKIEAFEAWSKTLGSPSVTVAVLDTGVDINHPDLKENIWTNPRETLDSRDNDGNMYVDDIHGWDFVDGDNDPSPNLDERLVTADAVHHGTLIAGIIAGVANNGIGGAGIAPRVKIMPLRVLDSRGRGNVGTVMEGIRYAMKNGADIINLSFVGPGFDQELFTLLRQAKEQGILVVGAVGNEGTVGIDLDSNPLYPVCYSGEAGEDVVFGVAASAQDDTKPRFTNYGANCVDLSAPGVQIYGPFFYNPARGYSTLFGVESGSSMAAPQVAGVAALIKSLNPAFQGEEIRDILLASADPLAERDPAFLGKLGKGRLNARRALELAASGGVVAASSGHNVPYVLTGPYSGAEPKVETMRQNGTSARSFYAYAPTYRKGIRVTSGDVNGDGVAEIVTGAGPGGGPQVRVFRSDGTAVGSFFAYDPRFRGGVNVAVGDIDGDGVAEIVAGAGVGGGPQVRIFSAQGKVIGSFFAYDSRFRGGVNVAVGDIDGDGRAEIITGPGRGAGTGSEVRVFDAQGNIKRRFVTFPKQYTGGVNVAVGALNGEGGGVSIVVAPQGGVSPEIRVYTAAGVWQRAFLAYGDTFYGGVNLVVGDVDRDGKADIVTGPGAGGGPHVRVFDGFGQVEHEFFALPATFRGGVSVGIIKL